MRYISAEHNPAKNPKDGIMRRRLDEKKQDVLVFVRSARRATIVSLPFPWIN